MADGTSRVRQRLLRVAQESREQLELLLGERVGLIRGSFGSRGRVCGTPNCKCTRGELHQSKYLTATDNGRSRQIHVPAGDEVMVAKGVERYRLFHHRRSRLAQLAKEQMGLVDALGRSLLQPYPADNPLPPPKRRGRPPKQDKA